MNLLEALVLALVIVGPMAAAAGYVAVVTLGTPLPKISPPPDAQNGDTDAREDHHP